MAYSEEDLQKYLKKAQEVLNSKTENHLSTEDLNDIAKNLGLNIQEIAQAREDYLTRGNTHLKFNNLDEAIGEFEQLLLLSPRHPKGLIGLAQAHLEKWQQNHKKTDKEKAQEYANQCIEIAPDLKQAYAIISDLKQKPQTAKKARQKIKPTPQQRATNKSKKQLTGTWLVAGILIVVVSVYQLYKKSVHHKKNVFTHSLKVGSTPQGLVLWQIKTKPNKTPPHYRQPVLQIAKAATGELLQEIMLPNRNNVSSSNLWYYSKQFNQSFYDLHRGSFVARDVLTGKITNNRGLLAGKFPELSGGISSISIYSGDWLKVINNKGAQYLFFPATQQLIKIRQYGQARSKRWQYAWMRIFESTNSNQYKVVLTKVYRYISHIYTHNRRYLRYSNKSLQKGIAQGRFKLITPLEKANSFLWPKLVYSDSTHTILRYKTNLGKQAKYRLACLDRSGSVVWEKGKDDIEAPLFKVLVSSRSLITFARHKNVLGISSSDVTIVKNNKAHRYRMAFGLNLDTGQVLWKYSPRYYKSEFKKASK